ncbi:MAG: hypothetical protein R3D71_07390 [Rickettsiales bacterium]
MIEQETSVNWRVDKRIPIALLVTLFLQIAAALIWASQLNARVGMLEQESLNSALFGEKLARIDERLQSVRQHMEDIKDKVENIDERLSK